jgi:ParB family chromosome partitioning protein
MAKTTKPGKGLEALIPRKPKTTEVAPVRGAKSTDREGVFLVEVTAVEASPSQPRKHFAKEPLEELAASIKSHGILQPLVVEKFERETKSGVEVRYHLLAGERRLRAARLAGLKQVPVVVRKASDDRTRLLLGLIENVQREDLNAIERAEAYERLQKDFTLTQEEIADRIGKSREAVANTLRLLGLDTATRKAVREGRISEGHARAILKVPEAKRAALVERFVREEMSVRAAETVARQEAQRANVPTRLADPKRADAEDQLKQELGVPVRITHRGKRGSISLQFGSQEELEILLKRLLGK